jgi:hypothetical protein
VSQERACFRRVGHDEGMSFVRIRNVFDAMNGLRMNRAPMDRDFAEPRGTKRALIERRSEASVVRE